MILSEAEAKTKWCPHARVAIEMNDGTRVNAHNVMVVDGKIIRPKCITSECMMWMRYSKDGAGHCGLASELG